MAVWWRSAARASGSPASSTPRAPKGKTGLLTLDPVDLVIGGVTSDPLATLISALVFNTLPTNVNYSATNSITLQGSTPLTSSHDVVLSATNANATITVGTSLTATGSVVLSAGGAAPSGSTLAINSPVTGGGVTLGASTITIGAAVNAGASNTLTLTGGSVTQTGAGILTAGTLAGTTGAATLDFAANAITTLGPISSTGDFALLTGTAPLTIGGLVSAPANVVFLTTGGLAEAPGGAVVARGFQGTFTGPVTLGAAANNIAVLNAVTVTGGGYTLNNGGNALIVAQPLNAGGAVTLANVGALTQVAAGAITASSLQGSAASADLSAAPNHVASLAGFSVGGGFALNDASPLAITGPLAAPGHAVTLTVAGALTQTAAGTITAGTLQGQAGSADLSAAVNSAAAIGPFSLTGPFALNDGTAPLAVTGALSAPGQSVTLTSGALSQTAAGAITAGLLQGSSAGAANLGTAQNAVANLGAFNATGALTLSNGAAALSVDGVGIHGSAITLSSGSTLAVNAPLVSTGPVALASNATTINATVGSSSAVSLSGGSVSETASGAVGGTGTLGGSTTGPVSLGSPANTVSVLGDFASGGAFTLVNNPLLTVAIAGTLNVPTAAVTLTGLYNELPSGHVNALSLVAPGAVLNGGANNIGSIGAIMQASDYTLTDSVPLTLTGNIILTGGAVLRLNVASVQQASGTIQAAALTGTATGDVLLTAGNSIGNVNTLTVGGNFTLANGATALSIGTAGANSGITVGGAGGFTLQAGPVTQTAGGAIVAAALSGSTTGAVDFSKAANVINTLGAFNTHGGAFSLNDVAPALAIGGALAATGSTVSLSGGPVTESASGSVVADTLTVASSGSVTLTGGNAVANLGQTSFTGPFALTDSAALTILKPVNAGAGVVTLNTGGLSQAAAAPITAGALAGTASGPVDLSTATNAVSSISSFASAGNFALTNGPAPLAVTGALNAGGNTVSLTAAGGLTETGGITAGRLNASTSGPLLLTGANAVGDLGVLTFTGNLTVNNGANPLNVAAALNAPGNTVTLTAGALTQAAPIVAGTLTATVGGAVTLGGPGNAIGALGKLSAGGTVTLNDGANALALTGALTAPAAALNAGTLTQAASGPVTVGTLSVATAGPVALGAGNAVGSLGAVSTGGSAFVLNDGATPLVLAGR